MKWGKPCDGMHRKRGGGQHAPASSEKPCSAPRSPRLEPAALGTHEGRSTAAGVAADKEQPSEVRSGPVPRLLWAPQSRAPPCCGPLPACLLGFPAPGLSWHPLPLTWCPCSHRAPRLDCHRPQSLFPCRAGPLTGRDPLLAVCGALVRRAWRLQQVLPSPSSSGRSLCVPATCHSGCSLALRSPLARSHCYFPGHLVISQLSGYSASI